MASSILFYHFTFLLSLSLLCALFPTPSFANPRMLSLVKQKPLLLKYHNGLLLKPNVTVNLLWYGKFSPAQRSIIVDFLHSLNSTKITTKPSVSSWWNTIGGYKGGLCTVVVGKQVLDATYSLGKNTLTTDQLTSLASKAAGKVNKNKNVLNLVLTAADVTVEDFCMSTCGSHGFVTDKKTKEKFAYAWVGNSFTQCPGQCAWPFHKPIFGPQGPALVAPNGDVAIDGMVINVATVLAGAATNPYDNGYFQGPHTAPLEAVTACTGIFGTGAFPGNPGKVLVDKTTLASFNAYGINGRKYLLPAMWDPKTFSCKTLDEDREMSILV